MTQVQETANWFSRPADAIRSVMERKGIGVPELMDRAELSYQLIQQLFDGTKAINDDLAQRLSGCLGGTPTFWLKRQAIFEEKLDQVSTAA